MKKLLLGLILSFSLILPISIQAGTSNCHPVWKCGPTSSPTPTSTPTPTPSPSSSIYSFDDEFNGIALNSIWGRHWTGLSEAVANRSQTTVANGLLTITAIRSGTGWTSDLVDTWATWSQKYGYFAARMKIPKGAGMWPAFWIAQGWEITKPAELDINETCSNPIGARSGNDASLLHTTIHQLGGYQLTHDTRTTDMSLAFHVYAMSWRADHVSFYLDGIEIWRFTDTVNIPNVAMPVIANLAVGGSWCGASDSTTPNPSQLQVDWIRVSP